MITKGGESVYCGLQGIRGQVRVDLRTFDGRVTEKFGDGVEVYSVLG